YILMEYIRGPDLKKLLNELRRKGLALPLEHALRIVAETAAGLHYAHAYVDPAGVPHPVVHRDVSPHNVLISLDGAIKLSDFGIAKVQGEENTQAGVLKGKISYISPEAAAGRPLDARNDVFALGVVLFELLTGTLPFKRDHDAATLNAIVREPAPVPSQLKPTIPQDVSDLILRALVKDPARRTPSAAALREEIEAVMAHHRLNSSPAAVAQFFKVTLGERLAEFGPVTSSGPHTGSYPSVAPSGGTGSGARPSAPGGTGDVVAPGDSSVRSGTGSRPAAANGTGQYGAVPPPPPSAARQAAPPPPAPGVPPEERTEVYRPVQQGLIAPNALPSEPPKPVASPARPSLSGMPPIPPPPPPTVASRPGAMHQAAAAQAAPRPPGPAPAVPPRPSGPALQPAVPVSARAMTQTAPASAPMPGSVAAPPAQRAPVAAAPAPRAQAPAAPAPKAPAAAAPVASAALPAAKSSVSKWLVVGFTGVLIVAGAGVVVSKVGSGGGSEVINLEPGEKLYVGGLQADPKNVRLEGSEMHVISTAMNGSLRRFGTTSSKDVIDARTLPEAMPQKGSTGTVRIDGKAGCYVKVGTEMLSGSTPVKANIEAGRELEITVTCPGQPLWVQQVLAVPGQDLKLTPQPNQ
ncbi:serine/threonine-protein kinase, partial [Archangium sp.]|uniref:serine/threonine protein kinase n=1 Tax=Archangium sp. TaxID=1872627 RepID=UPI002EDA635D